MKLFLGTSTTQYNILNIGQSLTLKNFYINKIKSWKLYIPEYLCFTAKQANSTVAMKKNGSPSSLSLQYSTDGEVWSTFTPGTTTITLEDVNDCVYLRGTNSTISSSSSNYYQFQLTGSIEASGNIQSLLDQTLQKTNVANYCYYKLFYQCTALTTAPALPATTLGNYCYGYMFSGCSNITKAPKLPATTLVTSCYQYMFQNCSKLNDIEVSFIAWTSETTSNWVSGVASSGTFHCYKALPTTRGTSNIPSNWTIDSKVMPVAIPTITGSYTFNGSSQSATINGYNSTFITQSGTVSATNAGTYTVTWALKSTTNYQWEDGTTTNKTATWTIDSKPIAIIITGTGNTNSCYATINGTKYFEAGTIAFGLGSTSTKIDLHCIGYSTSQVGSITVNGTTMATSTSVQTAAEYSYTIPTNITNITIALVQTAKKSGSTMYYYSINLTSGDGVIIPSVNGTYLYNGTAQSPIVSFYNSSIMTQSGTTSATNTGNYTITWSLKDKTNNHWSDGTTTDKSATWTISARPVAVTITGTGNSTKCYATVGGTKYSAAGSTTLNINNTTTTITLACTGYSTSYVGQITINGTAVATSNSTTTTTYTYTVPANINNLNIALVQTAKKSGSSTYYYSVNVTTS